MPRLSEAASSGNRRATLEALRDKLAASVESCDSGRDTAALSKRLMEVMAEIDAIPDASSCSPVMRNRGRAAKRKGADGG